MDSVGAIYALRRQIAQAAMQKHFGVAPIRALSYEDGFDLGYETREQIDESNAEDAARDIEAEQHVIDQKWEAWLHISDVIGVSLPTYPESVMSYMQAGMP